MAREGKNFFIGALVGTVLGGITALLFAPKSGEKLRRDISKNTRQAAEKTQGMVRDMSYKTKELASSLGDQVDELVDKAQGIAEKTREAMESLGDAARRMRRK